MRRLPADEPQHGLGFDVDHVGGKLEILPEEWQKLGIKPSRMFSIVPNIVAPVAVSSFWTGG